MATVEGKHILIGLIVSHPALKGEGEGGGHCLIYLLT